jgi:hypothetical protein
MRTLVDLLNDEKGYVRIFVDQGSFGYEKSAYSPEHSDLFDRMGGYASMANAREAALLQLQVVKAPAKRRRKKKS